MPEQIKIFTLTHKKFNEPSDPMYVPLQVGAALHEKLAYITDDTGDNISAKNIYYSELTGLYWIWKNVRDLDYVGTCHYRRFLIDENEHIFNRTTLLELLKKYDVITTKKVHLNNSYHYGFSANHNMVALDTTGLVIKDLFPEYYDNFVRLVNGPDTYFGNMLICAKPVFDSYCRWLFTIFAEVEKRTNLDTNEDAYHKRVLGFISEFLLGVWLSKHDYSVLECKVGMLGEKKEVTEMKNRLAIFFANRDIAGAKKYFCDQLKLRPDVLMEASDISGELHLSMQVIATAELEHEKYGRSVLDNVSSFKELMTYFNDLNRLVSDECELPETYSDIAIYVSKKCMLGNRE